MNTYQVPKDLVEGHFISQVVNNQTSLHSFNDTTTQDTKDHLLKELAQKDGG